jgi:hypothetical protein
MADEPQTLWGLPVVVTDAVPQGTAILARMPTYAELVQYGSFENYVEACKRQFAAIKLDDEVLNADEVG